MSEKEKVVRNQNQKATEAERGGCRWECKKMREKELKKCRC